MGLSNFRYNKRDPYKLDSWEILFIINTMNHVVCHTLEEASQRLNLSETVLVRLSQYFKVPASAYDSVDGLSLGGLSFKDDPLFMETDLAFFRELKERLVSGETLESLKRRPPKPVSKPDSVSVASAKRPLSIRPMASGETPITLSAALRDAENAKPLLMETDIQLTPLTGFQATHGSEDAVTQVEMRVLHNPNLLSKLAERSFKHYKHQNGVGFGQVFKKILNSLAEVILEPETALKSVTGAFSQETTPTAVKSFQSGGASERLPFMSAPVAISDFWSLSPVPSKKSQKNEPAEFLEEGIPALINPAADLPDGVALAAEREFPSAPSRAVYSRNLDDRISQAARLLKARALNPTTNAGLREHHKS